MINLKHIKPEFKNFEIINLKPTIHYYIDARLSQSVTRKNNPGKQ